MSSCLLRGQLWQAKEVRMARVDVDISMLLEGLVAAASDRRGDEFPPFDDIDAERIGHEAAG